MDRRPLRGELTCWWLGTAQIPQGLVLPSALCPLL